MAYDIEQQESLANFKGWLEDNAKSIIGAIVMVAVVWGGTSAWHWYRDNQASAASVAYDQYLHALESKDKDQAGKALQSLKDAHGSSAIASLAALTQAKLNLDAGDLAGAKAQLQFVIDKDVSHEFSLLARVRLAGILLDEKAYDAALNVLPGDPPAALAAEVSDRRGDILFAQGKINESRAAYAKALEQVPAQSPLKAMIETKLEALPSAG
jgi:predicted negative regulator of RcsB-dependent stress response